MWSALWTRWSKFLDSKPGRRFQDRYHRRRESAYRVSSFTGYANAVGGLVVVLLGIVFIPVPGPGWVVLFLGLGLLSGDYLPLARVLDRAEFRVRTYTRLIRWQLKEKRLFAWGLLVLSILTGMALLVVGLLVVL